MKSVRRSHVLSVLIMGMALLACCGFLEAKSNFPDPKAIAVWHKHERAFQRALKGYQKNDEFDQACLFFEQITGLTVHVNNFTLGTLPTPETKHDLVRIRAWYKVNKNRLYWDESTRTVKVRPKAARP